MNKVFCYEPVWGISGFGLSLLWNGIYILSVSTTGIDNGDGLLKSYQYQ